MLHSYYALANIFMFHDHGLLLPLLQEQAESVGVLQNADKQPTREEERKIIARQVPQQPSLPPPAAMLASLGRQEPEVDNDVNTRDAIKWVPIGIPHILFDGKDCTEDADETAVDNGI